MTDAAASSPCKCASRPSWARLEDDTVLRWPVTESGDWEELRQCPECCTLWLCAWPEELESNPILCRPLPPDIRRLREVDRIETLRPYCLARLEEHLGELKEEKRPCKKIGCEKRRIRDTGYCLEHHIAQRFGRQLSRLDRVEPEPRPPPGNGPVRCYSRGGGTLVIPCDVPTGNRGGVANARSEGRPLAGRGLFSQIVHRHPGAGRLLREILE